MVHVLQGLSISYCLFWVVAHNIFVYVDLESVELPWLSSVGVDVVCML